ncbi:MAG: hypothetical protein V8R81_01440 [Clostridia bacterium]
MRVGERLQVQRLQATIQVQSISKASSITLYAIWTPKNYEVTYTANSKTIVKLTNSLQEAISYANTSTIKVYLSTTESKQVTISSGKTITLDMNGKTITGAIKNNGTLTTEKFWTTKINFNS